jgi:hypothetical protein
MIQSISSVRSFHFTSLHLMRKTENVSAFSAIGLEERDFFFLLSNVAMALKMRADTLVA